MPLIIGVLTLVFFILHAAPGDATAYFFNPNMSPEVITQLKHNFGLDQPVYVQYFQWLASFLTGRFGYSLINHRPVAAILAERIPNTLMLTGAAFVVIFVVGIALGVIQSVRKGSLLDESLTFGSLFIYSMPSFWLAIMLILVFSYLAHQAGGWPAWLRFPASGMASMDYDLLSGWGRLVDRLRHLVLPTIALGLASVAAVSRYMRSSMLEVLRQDYIRTARAKGLPRRTVVLKHALKNALLPIVTLLGLYLPFLFSGAVLVETVFAWPGMGKTIVDAISQRDFPVVMASTFVLALMVVVGNLIADILYGLVDPRVRYE